MVVTALPITTRLTTKEAQAMTNATRGALANTDDVECREHADAGARKEHDVRIQVGNTLPTY